MKDPRWELRLPIGYRIISLFCKQMTKPFENPIVLHYDRIQTHFVMVRRNVGDEALGAGGTKDRVFFSKNLSLTLLRGFIVPGTWAISLVLLGVQEEHLFYTASSPPAIRSRNL